MKLHIFYYDHNIQDLMGIVVHMYRSSCLQIYLVGIMYHIFLLHYLHMFIVLVDNFVHIIL